MKHILLSVFALLIVFSAGAQVISGDTTVCTGGSITLTGSPGGGTWSSSNPSIATVGSSSGIVAGIAPGTVSITYNAGISGTTSVSITVYPSPSAISCGSGGCSVCQGASMTLTDAIAGGTWSTSDPSVATVDIASGDVTGIASGTAFITYTLPTGCFVTAPVIVNPSPAAISGIGAICVGSTVTFTDATPSGTWSTSSSGVATVSSGGTVTGAGAGMATISYTVAGCSATTNVTVNPSPTPITGPTSVCVGSCVAYVDGISGGTWTSSNPGVATIGASSGIFCAIAPGTTIVDYTFSAGCSASVTVNVMPGAAPISGSPAVCVGGTSTLSTASTGGTWSSGGSIASVSGGGVATGISAGVEMITYTLSSGCSTTFSLTVNPVPAPVSGITGICSGSSSTLSTSPSGGSWSSSNPPVASVGLSTGIVTGASVGTAFITYTLPTGCLAAVLVTVNPVPSAITGTSLVCSGTTTTFASGTPGGLWSSGSTGIATVGSVSGVVTAVSSGTTTITYTLPTGCFAMRNVSVNPSPSAIAGITTVCIGATSTLTTSTGGMWSSTAPSIATIGSTGLVTGITTGTSMISYTLPNGCFDTAVVTVISSPAAIAGPSSVCVFATTTLTDATSGGAWLSSNPALATIGSGTGLVTGVATGTLTITYSLGGGCFAVSPITVNPLPAAITGPANVCIGHTIGLFSTSAGGSWTSTGTNATVAATTGVVTGVAAGLETITYTLPTGCFTTTTVSVDPLPCPTLGTGTMDIAAVNIYPNPAFDEISIDAAAAFSNVTITNNVGQVVLTQQLRSPYAAIHIGSLPPALYYITLTGSGGPVVRKFVKQ